MLLSSVKAIAGSVGSLDKDMTSGVRFIHMITEILFDFHNLVSNQNYANNFHPL